MATLVVDVKVREMESSLLNGADTLFLTFSVLIIPTITEKKET